MTSSVLEQPRVLALPSDQDAVELGRLDRGDQVDLLRLENGFALVKAPDGLRGWVEASTLETPGDA